MAGRGRPKEVVQEIKSKFIKEYYEYHNEELRDQGWYSKWHYDDKKSSNGPWKVEYIPPKGWKPDEEKIIKNQTYAGGDVVMVFNTSNRSNAKTKMKIWKNTNVDAVNSATKLPGVPDKAVILELGVGETMINEYKLKYNL